MTVQRVYENLILLVYSGSGNPVESLELIQALSAAVFDIISDQDFREDFSNRYGAEVLEKLVSLTVPV